MYTVIAVKYLIVENNGIFHNVLPFFWLFQVVWQPCKTELGHLPTFCFIGRDMWTARVPFMFLASREIYTGPYCSLVWDGTKNAPKC